MMGDIRRDVDGLYQMATKDIYWYLEDPTYKSLKVGVSFYEIYCDKIFDLLNGRE